jgi:hypothetical protein
MVRFSRAFLITRSARSGSTAAQRIDQNYGQTKLGGGGGTDRPMPLRFASSNCNG